MHEELPPYYGDEEIDEPWADPSIQADYQAALGEFLVKFNGLENLVGDVLANAFGKLGRRDLYLVDSSLSQKLHTLEVVCLAMPQLHKPDVKRIKDLIGERNTLAHGHFDQNPYSGEYSLKTSKKKPTAMPVAKVRTLTGIAAAATNDVRVCMATFWFDGVHILPPGASETPI